MNRRAHLRCGLVSLALAVLALGSMDGAGDSSEVASEIEHEIDREVAPSRRDSTSSARPAAPSMGEIRTDLASVLAALSDDGYTADQRDALFERDSKDRWFLVEGRVKDVGTWVGRKYVTLEVAPENFCDVYFDDEFDLLSVRKGEQRAYVGRFDFLGTGVMFHRQFEDGREPPPGLASSTAGRSSAGPLSSPSSSSSSSSSPASSTPLDLRRVLATLSADSLSLDQREALFERDYEGRVVVVRGPITDVGTWLGEKYLTIDLGGGHLVDVYPSEDFDLLAYRTGEVRGFSGRFAFLGLPEMLHHRVESAQQAP